MRLPGRGRPATAGQAAVDRWEGVGPAGRRRPPGREGRPWAERGSATAETAVILPGLVLVLAAALWAVSIGVAQVRCVDAAREAARALSRGEGTAAAIQLTRRAAPGAAVSTSAAGGVVTVVVRATVRPVGWLGAHTPAQVVTARADAPLEPGVSP